MAHINSVRYLNYRECLKIPLCILLRTQARNIHFILHLENSIWTGPKSAHKNHFHERRKSDSGGTMSTLKFFNTLPSNTSIWGITNSPLAVFKRGLDKLLNLGCRAETERGGGMERG